MIQRLHAQIIIMIKWFMFYLFKCFWNFPATVKSCLIVFFFSFLFCPTIDSPCFSVSEKSLISDAVSGLMLLISEKSSSNCCSLPENLGSRPWTSRQPEKKKGKKIVKFIWLYFQNTYWPNKIMAPDKFWKKKNNWKKLSFTLSPSPPPKEKETGTIFHSIFLT